MWPNLENEDKDHEMNYSIYHYTLDRFPSITIFYFRAFFYSFCFPNSQLYYKVFLDPISKIKTHPPDPQIRPKPFHLMLWCCYTSCFKVGLIWCQHLLSIFQLISINMCVQKHAQILSIENRWVQFWGGESVLRFDGVDFVAANQKRGTVPDQAANSYDNKVPFF